MNLELPLATLEAPLQSIGLEPRRVVLLSGFPPEAFGTATSEPPWDRIFLACKLMFPLFCFLNLPGRLGYIIAKQHVRHWQLIRTQV
ncbi:hypothetical protein E2C01_058501 [Portunus trituberculatus]|uniref:Uncharacterized protein n=1 Tax=Portunus trituberculatus TaxID=210409 RepID=A0A5B7H3C9_PORTR|nr:hypothetical protein [Portunus trituberculatus]